MLLGNLDIRMQQKETKVLSVTIYENQISWSMAQVVVLQDIQAGKQDTKAFRETIFINVPAVGQWIHIQRLSPENKGALPYIALQTGYRSEKQSLTHIWLLVISLATSSSVLCDHFQVQFL
jgi:hypothetical protein